MKFQLDNGFLAYDHIGMGIPLLLIHGYPLSRRIWEPQMEGFPEFASLISVDLRGHGGSYPFEGPYSMELLAEDCKQLLDNIDIKSPILVCGLSMGGYVTMALFRKYPHLFKGMILTSTRPGPDSPEAKSNRDVGIKNVHDQGVVIIVESMLPKLVSPITLSSIPNLVKHISDIMMETSVNGVVGALQGMRDRPDSTPFLPQIKCPVLIIHGADDQLISYHEAEFMNQELPDSRLVILPEAGHLPNLEQPERFNQAVRDFILSLAQD
jgi:pimeloyl-ACP methyl ester carboxylesterase